MSSGFTPHMGQSGIYQFKEPFDSYYRPSEYILKVISIRSFEELSSSGYDVFEQYYDFHSIDEDEFDQDAENGVYIVTFEEQQTGFQISIPSSYIDGPPTSDIVDYHRMIVSVDMGMIPRKLDIEHLLERVSNDSKMIIGIQPTITKLSAPYTGIITREEHESLESARKEQIEQVDSDYMRYLHEKEKRQKLDEKIDTLERIVIEAGILPRDLERPSTPEPVDQRSDRRELRPSVTIELKEPSVDQDDTFESTDWKVFKAGEDEPFIEYEKSYQNRYKITLTRDDLDEGADYYAIARHHTEQEKYSDWSEEIEFDTYPIFSHILISKSGGQFLTLNPEDHEIINQSSIGEVDETAYVDEQTIIAINLSGTFRRINTHSLSNENRRDFEISEWVSWTYDGDDRIYVAYSDGRVEQFDSDFLEISEATPFNSRVGTMSADKNHLLLASWGGELALTDPSDLSIVDQIEDLTDQRAICSYLTDEYVYIGYNEGLVIMADRSDLSNYYSFTRVDSQISAIYQSNDSLYVAYENGLIYRLDRDLRQRAVYEFDNTYARNIRIHDSYLYALTADRRLVVFDVDNLNEQSDREFDNDVYSIELMSFV